MSEKICLERAHELGEDCECKRCGGTFHRFNGHVCVVCGAELIRENANKDTQSRNCYFCDGCGRCEGGVNHWVYDASVFKTDFRFYIRKKDGTMMPVTEKEYLSYTNERNHVHARASQPSLPRGAGV